MDVDFILSGHDDVCNKTDLLEYTEYLKDLRTGVMKFIQEDTSLEEIKENINLMKYRDWRGYERHLYQNVEAVYEEIRATGKIPTEIYLYRMHIINKIMPFAIVYARDYARLKHLVIVSPMYLEGFYRLWLFDYVKPPKQKKKFSLLSFLKPKEEQPTCHLMQLNLETFDKKAREFCPEIVEMIDAAKNDPNFTESFENSFYPDQAALQAYFQSVGLPKTQK